MQEILRAASGFPAVLFTSALVVAVGFWLLVLVGALAANNFDADLDLGPAGLGAVPVSVALSTGVVVGWLSTVTGSVLIDHLGLARLPHAAADLGLLLGSLPLAWCATRALTWPATRLSARRGDRRAGADRPARGVMDRAG
ncbi:hypothetical protein [Streptomyces alfalfae]|uniref:Uncharacterized protein n=1 Tax=Streptomyces alfalfae TaxID=1642299 RepID=A0A7T4PCA6_9ACTN|nr:hypothetical protein [Streptomyces alfalfae]QQC87626.1 hypothetical protein I8755_03795 [Streptomyces alfalfae]